MTIKATKSGKRTPDAKRGLGSRRRTKKVQLIRMLSAKTGADLVAVSKTLSWQTHTTRAALSGLRKAGYEVVGEQPGEGKPTRYRIVAWPADAGDTAVDQATDAR
ncbi:DUF3489 domain-containing protein [Roseovarius aestuariivivens]|uniref:DUF3489 domain-containing protein n=1 Tax=Roseovarius aestuariivivens TaxID=1888910 RepID=UPI001081E16D|nr:DUF3489 domain-containing protein [Roseovarius aestuariivivens]